MSLLRRLIRLLVGAAVDEVEARLQDPEPPHPGPRDVAIQNRASHVPEEHKVRTMTVDEYHEKIADPFRARSEAVKHQLGLDDNLYPKPSSPRAITHDARPLPPPRKR